jgi:NADP-dependent 3-hydroxy acid dehydrogenase YdfG
MKPPLKDKWILITGASSGFGAAAARAFGAEGAKLLLGARRVDRLKKAAAEAKKSGAVESHFHELDVSKTSSVEEFISWSRDKIGRGNLHVLSTTPAVRTALTRLPRARTRTGRR